MMTYNLTKEKKNFLARWAKEIKEAAEVEIYYFWNPGESRIHTDTIKSLEMSVEDLPEFSTDENFYEKVEVEYMDVDTYDASINANSSFRWADVAEPDEKCLVIVLPYGWQEGTSDEE